MTHTLALVANVRRGTPSPYETDWCRATRRHRLLTDLLVRARRQPAPASRIMPTVARLPRLFAAAVNALA
ncbi:hypothetical protein ACIBL8_42185 [Streptomyces sp. NPDC050523]|uniref:hypothetical protein n=1 Tax=Streptomyces sp. NPDC050523 TaxID=3365622 RepID=UPI0037B3FCCE